MASLLLDALRGLILGEATDYAKEKAKPYVDRAMDSMREPQQAITPGARMDDRGYPTMSEMLPAQTSGYRQQVPGVTSGAADPRVLQSMYDQIAADQTMREQEVDADFAAENKQSVLDAVRRAGGSVGTAQTQPYTPSGDDSAMFQPRSILDADPAELELSAEKAKMAQESGDPEQQAAVAEVMKNPDAARNAFMATAHGIELGKQGEDDPGFFESIGDTLSGIGSGISDFVKNNYPSEEQFLMAGLAFNTLRHRPDPGYAAIIGKRLENIRGAKKAPIIAQKLRDMGYGQYADLVLQQPEMAEDIVKQIIQKELKPQASAKVSGVQVDEETGELFQIVSYADGTFERRALPGKGLTKEAELAAQGSQDQRNRSFTEGRTRSGKILDKADNLGGQIEGLREVQRQLDKGADTGYFMSKLPSFNEASIALDNARNQLGLSVIGGTTFGALSESELQFALSTALPDTMEPEALKQWVARKIETQEKVRRALIAEAQKMSQLGYDDYLEQMAKQVELSAAAPAAPQAPATPTDLPPIKLKSVRPVGQ